METNTSIVFVIENGSYPQTSSSSRWREFELLEYLMRNERIVISRQRLLDEVWGYDPFSMTNTIEVFVSNLRRTLEAGGEPRLLHTIRGAGYVLRV